MNASFPRQALIARILSFAQPVTVVEAPAGMGKTMLLEQIAAVRGLPIWSSPEAPPEDGHALTLWDIPPYGTPAPLPERYLAGKARIVIGKRPGVAPAGLARAFAYGRAAQLEMQALLLSEDEAVDAFGAAQAAGVLARSGAWPLVAFRPAGIDTMAGFLRHEFLDAIADAKLVDLRLLADGQAVREREPGSLFPIAQAGLDRKLVLAVGALAEALREAVDIVIEERLATPAGVKAIAEAYADHGLLTEAIATFQRAGFHDNALAQFHRAGGLFFIYFQGPAAFDIALAGFPASYAHQSETLVLSLALQALKRGDISRARRLLSDRFGEGANDIANVFSARSVFSREFREFRFLMLIYEDYQFSEELLASLFTLIAEFPGDAHLFRGSFYNSVLEFYIRRRQFAEAEEVAQRAMYHYRAADAPMLCFYISLHQAMIALMTGDTVTARKHAALSAKSLAEVPFETPNDMRLQALLEACVEYEGGRAEPLARFLNTEIDDFSHGEIWPSLMEFTLLYGSQAMATHFSLLAARGFLDRWRVYQISNQAFQTMVGIREAIVLQNANRWSEAASRLKANATTIDRDWLLAHPQALSQLADRDDIGMALAWLRQMLHEQSNLGGLEDMLTAALGNLNITDRQRMGVGIWLACLYRRRQDLTQARALLLRIFEDAARLGSVAPLSEEQLFLTELLDNKRISDFLEASSSARQVIRRLRDSGHLSPTSGIRSELSRRENKILVMLSEGAANKSIAGMLGVSEATVKFHLGNIYRKLGCRKRQEAIATARAAGIVS
jgi:ATP/maltotriose-dependent transcriptional regulator MalT